MTKFGAAGVIVLVVLAVAAFYVNYSMAETPAAGAQATHAVSASGDCPMPPDACGTGACPMVKGGDTAAGGHCGNHAAMHGAAVGQGEAAGQCPMHTERPKEEPKDAPKEAGACH